MASTARSLGVVAALLCGAEAAVGCGGSSTSGRPPAAAANAPADDDAASGLREYHRYHHHGGVTLFIAMSLDTLGVSPEQRTAVEKIRADLHARMEPARIAEQNLVTTLADGLAAANVDAAKVDAAVAQVTAAAAALHEATADALNALHAVLTPPQRSALVDKVVSHSAVWQKVNATETAPASPEGDHVTRLARELGLTADQEDKIRAGLGGERAKAMPRLDPQEIATHLQAFGDAFRSEKFDARALTTASDANAHLVAWGAAHMAHFLEAVSPVLTVDQRAKLAERLREHATHDPIAEGNL
jgi:Spy/CpxP family protein refolding chaperone